MSRLHFLLRYIMGILIYLYSFWCYHIPKILGQGPGTKTCFFKVKDKNYRPSEMLSWDGEAGKPLLMVKKTNVVYRKWSLKRFRFWVFWVLFRKGWKDIIGRSNGVKAFWVWVATLTKLWDFDLTSLNLILHLLHGWSVLFLPSSTFI